MVRNSDKHPMGKTYARWIILSICSAVFTAGSTGCKVLKGDATPLLLTGTPIPGGCEGGVAHGQTVTRARFQEGTVAYGMGSCVSEEQTATCDDGALQFSGPFMFESCFNLK